MAKYFRGCLDGWSPLLSECGWWSSFSKRDLHICSPLQGTENLKLEDVLDGLAFRKFKAFLVVKRLNPNDHSGKRKGEKLSLLKQELEKAFEGMILLIEQEIWTFTRRCKEFQKSHWKKPVPRYLYFCHFARNAGLTIKWQEQTWRKKGILAAVEKGWLILEKPTHAGVVLPLPYQITGLIIMLFHNMYLCVEKCKT